MNEIILYVLIGFTVLILTIIVIIIEKKDNLKELENNITKCEIKLLESLLNKEELLIVEIRKSKDKELLKELKTEEETNLFDLDKFLYNKRNQLNKLIDDNKYKIKKEAVVKLNEAENNIEGLKDYYNSKASIYNSIYLKKPMYFLYKSLGFYKKEKFNLRKIEEYDILKD